MLGSRCSELAEYARPGRSTFARDSGQPVRTLLPRGASGTLPERLLSTRIVTERLYWSRKMKALIGFATVLVALAAVTTADAKGCLKGAAVGGVAGHYSGHHGLLGAAAGCAVGRHEANKRAREQQENRTANQPR